MDFAPAMRMALNAAEQFLGLTAPNPPVGAVALDKNGKVLLGAGHEKAGSPHAEAKLLALAERLGKAKDIHTLVVTLEPCNHKGRTPPCTEAILRHKNIRRVVIGTKDPNPDVKGGGAEYLRSKGVELVEGVLEDECRLLIRQFAYRCKTGRPYATLKTALNEAGSMIPPEGRKTFTSEGSLRFAHELRKRADALWTGSGTILADQPEFTVRHVPDFKDKKRYLLISDRRGRVPQEYKEAAQKRGFTLFFPQTLEKGLDFLGKQGTLEVLVEAGPALQKAFLESGLWQEHVVIKKGREGTEDEIDVHWNY